MSNYIRHWYIAGLSAILLLQGCATHYMYHGALEARNSANQPRTITVHWMATERRFWFDNTHGSIELKTECSFRTVHFRERADGIIFEREPDDEGAFEPVELYGKCGEVHGVKRISKIQPGEFQLTIYCHESASERHLYLRPAREPYVFQIVRELVDDPRDATMQPPVCRESL